MDETVEVKLQGLRREMRQLESTKADAERRFKEALATLPVDIERQIQRVMRENDKRKDLFNKIVHEQMDIRFGWVLVVRWFRYVLVSSFFLTTGEGEDWKGFKTEERREWV